MIFITPQLSNIILLLMVKRLLRNNILHSRISSMQKKSYLINVRKR
nr:MAG TPA: hypothetical protein [Caudoviricetes sp.]